MSEKAKLNIDICKAFFDDLKEQTLKDKDNIVIKNPLTKKKITIHGETYFTLWLTCFHELKDTSYDFDGVPKPEKVTGTHVPTKPSKSSKSLKKLTFEDKIKNLTLEDIKKWKKNPLEEPFDYNYMYDKTIYINDKKYIQLYKKAFILLFDNSDISTNEIITPRDIDIDSIYKILDILLNIKTSLPSNHIIKFGDVKIDYLFDNMSEKFLKFNNIVKYKDIYFYTILSQKIEEALIKIDINQSNKDTIKDIIYEIIKYNNYNLIITILQHTIVNAFDKIIVDSIIIDRVYGYTSRNNTLYTRNIDYILNYFRDLIDLTNNYKSIIDITKIDINQFNNDIIKLFKQAGYFNIDESPKDYLNTFFIEIYNELFIMLENAKLVAEKYNILPPELDFKVNIDDESPQYPIIKYNKDLETYKIKKRGDPTIKLNEEYEKLIEENNKLYQKYDEDKEKYDKELEKRKNKSVSYLGSLTPPNKGKNKSQLLKELLPSGSDTKNIKCNNLIDINTQEEIKDMPLNKLQLLVKVVVREHHDIDDAYKHEFEHYTDDDWTDNIKNPIKYTYCYDPFALYNYVVQSVNENKDPINLAGRKKLSKENLREMVKSIKFITKKRDQRVPVRNTPNDKNLNLIFILDGNYYRALLCYKIYDIDIVLYHLITFPADIDIPTTITSIEGTSVGIIILLRILFESNKLFVKHIYPFYISVNANISYYNRYIYNSYEFTDYRNKENWEGINKIERMKEFYRELEAHI